MVNSGVGAVFHRTAVMQAEECMTPPREHKSGSCPSSPPALPPHGAAHVAGRAQSQPPTPLCQGEFINDHTSPNVRVVCRLRPMSERERKAGTVPAVTGSTEQKEIAVVRTVGGTRHVRSTFHFDEVLTSFSTQREVYAATLQPLVQQVLQGYDATAFAYGQTGTGKTYTMEGQTDSEDKRGLIPRAAAAVLDALKHKSYIKHQVTMSYLEIYNEELSDLLAPQQSQTKLEIMDRGENRGVCCVGLSEVPVSSLTDIFNLVRMAQERRRVAETRINSRSSRSHCIFTLKVHCVKAVVGGELENIGKLHLVDLAGSECAKKAVGGTDEVSAPRHGGRAASPRPGAGHHYGEPASALEQERERRNINQSLLTLGRVIAALREKTGRVPYRDSKLTRLLKDALGGSCKTVLIATVSPALSAVEESISTLTYAEQAAGIRNRPVALSSLRMIRSNCNGEMRGELSCTSSGGSSVEWAEMEMKMNYLAQEVEEAQTALAKKYEEEQQLRQRAECAEGKLLEAQADLQQLSAVLEESQTHNARMVASSQAVAKELSASVSFFAAARDDLAREVSELREDRASEERLLALLRQQRKEIDVDISTAQSTLGTMKAEIAMTSAEVAKTRKIQERSQGRALEAIIAFATNEFKNLGTESSENSEAICARLENVEALACKVKDSVVSAGGRSTNSCMEVEGAVSSLARSFVAKIETIGQQSEDASEKVEGSMFSAVDKLCNIEVVDTTCASDGEQETNIGNEPTIPLSDRAIHFNKENTANSEILAKRKYSEKRIMAGGVGNAANTVPRGVLKERNTVR